MRHGSDIACSTTSPTAKRINVHDDYELRFWSKKFGVSPNELRCAVSKVGVFADNVARELGILEVRDAPLICP